jgi:hypothetical protein
MIGDTLNKVVRQELRVVLGAQASPQAMVEFRALDLIVNSVRGTWLGGCPDLEGVIETDTLGRSVRAALIGAAISRAARDDLEWGAMITCLGVKVISIERADETEVKAVPTDMLPMIVRAAQPDALREMMGTCKCVRASVMRELVEEMEPQGWTRVGQKIVVDKRPFCRNLHELWAGLQRGPPAMPESFHWSSEQRANARARMARTIAESREVRISVIDARRRTLSVQLVAESRVRFARSIDMNARPHTADASAVMRARDDAQRAA